MASSTIPRASSSRLTRMIIIAALGEIWTMKAAVWSTTPMTEAAQVKMPAKTTMNMITELVTLASTSTFTKSATESDR